MSYENLVDAFEVQQFIQRTASLLNAEKLSEWVQQFDAAGTYEVTAYSTELARIFHRSRATNEYGIALVCPKIQVSNLDQRAGNAEAKLYRRN